MRFFLLASTVFSIIIPLFRLPKLFSTPIQSVGDIPTDIITVVTPTEVAVSEVSILTFENAMWFSLLVSFILLSNLIVRIASLIRLKRRSVVQSYDDVAVRRVANVTGSFTFFKWIFISDDIDKSHQGLKAVLMHEQAHARLGHTYDRILLDIYNALFWWLPSSWYIKKEIKIIHEYQADAYALESMSMDQYSEVLIKSTLKSNGLSIASSFHEGLIFKRLKAMKQQTKKVQVWKYGVLTSLCLSLFVIFACSEEKVNIVETSFQDSNTEVQREIFTKVEEQPSYKGGMDAFYQYVMSEVRYPLQARKNGITGTVQVQFVIERNGAISNIKGFLAGSQRGRTVRTTMVMPVSFKLNPDKKNADGSIQGAVIAGQVITNNGSLGVTANYNNGEWSGKVVDPDGNTLPGTNIVVAGTNYGTVAGMDGTFKVKAKEDQVLQISFVGYGDVNIGGRN